MGHIRNGRGFSSRGGASARAAAITGAFCVVVLVLFLCLYLFRAIPRDPQMVQWLGFGALTIVAASAFAWIWAKNLPRVNTFPKKTVRIDKTGLIVFGEHFAYTEAREIVVCGNHLTVRLKSGEEQSISVPANVKVLDVITILRDNVKVSEITPAAQ